MPLKISLEAQAVLAIFVVVVSAALLVPFWHSMPFVVFSSSSVFLQEYPVQAFEDEQSCILLRYHLPDNLVVKNVDLRIFSEGSQLFFERFEAEQKDFFKQTCFDSGRLEQGHSRIEILSLGNSLFFNLDKLPGQRPPKQETRLAILGLEKDTVQFEVSNFDTSQIKPVEIFVNGEFDHAVFPQKESQSFEERIEMHPGQNKVEVSFNGKVSAADFEQDPRNALPLPIGIALLSFSFFAFGCFLFPKKGFVERMALGIALSLVLLTALVFSLNYLNLLNFYSVTGLFLLCIIVALLAGRKSLKQTFSKERIIKLSPLIWIAIALFFTIPIFFHFFSFTDITYWNKFYERQTSMIVGANTIPVWDELSYFGRTYSFSPGYFVMEAGISFVTGLQGTGLYALTLSLANIFFFFSLFYLGRALKLSDKKIAMFAMFTAMSSFLLSALVYSPRHVLSFAFFIVALATLIKHNKPIVTGLFLAVTAFIQFPLIIFFPLFYAIIARKIELKRMLKAFIAGLVLAFILMLPHLMLYGLPFQASPEEWGYLINYNLYYWFLDIVAILVFFVLFSLTDLFKGNSGKDFYSRKLILGFILGTLIQLFVIYRWNILTTTTLALLIVVLFPEKYLKISVVERILSILALVAFGFLLLGMSYLNVHEIVTTPVSFVESYTSTDSQILSDPMFGHNMTSVAGRPVLADLRVEYADQEKLEDAYTFLEKRQYSILEKYEIDYTLNQVDYIHRQAIGGQPKYGIIEFPPLDKIYSNGFLFIHRVSKNWKERV
jgi:hypothetical protein